MSNMSFSPGSTVVLDTSVLMAQDNILAAYSHADVVLPLTVVDELDNNKHRDDEGGRNARSVLRQLEVLRAGTALTEPIHTDGGGSVRVVVNGVRTDVLERFHLGSDSADNRIIGAALALAADSSQVTLVSNDAAMRIKAAVVGLRSCEHTALTPVDSKGWYTIEVPFEDADMIRAAGESGVPLDRLGAGGLFSDLNINEFVVARSGTQSLLARKTSEGITALPRTSPGAWGAGAKNKEQAFSLHLLTDSTVSLVALDGPAGTGKTFLAVAAGLEQTSCPAFGGDGYRKNRPAISR